MSTLPGNATKGEKAKPHKFQRVNIASYASDKSSEPEHQQQQKSNAPRGSGKHGMTILGRAPPTRRPPSNLPSLKAEQTGHDSTCIVPSTGAIWGGKAESTTAATAQSSAPLSEDIMLNGPMSGIPLQLPPASLYPNMMSYGYVPGADGKPWQPSMTHGQPDAQNYQRFKNDFPSLSCESTGAIADGGTSKTGEESTHVPGECLRPQTEVSWMLNGSRPQGLGAPILGSSSTAVLAPGHQAHYLQTGPDGARNNLAHSGAAVGRGGPNQTQMGPAFGAGMPHFAYATAGYPPNMQAPMKIGQRPPFGYSGAVPPHGLLDRRSSVSGDSNSGHVHHEAEPILKDEALKEMAHIVNNDIGWARQDNVDYNKKLNFSDDEDDEKNAEGRNKKSKLQARERISERKSVSEKEDMMINLKENIKERATSLYLQENEVRKAWMGGRRSVAQISPQSPRYQMATKFEDDEENWQKLRKQKTNEVELAIQRAKERKEMEERRFVESQQAASKQIQMLENMQQTNVWLDRRKRQDDEAERKELEEEKLLANVGKENKDLRQLDVNNVDNSSKMQPIPVVKDASEFRELTQLVDNSPLVKKEKENTSPLLQRHQNTATPQRLQNYSRQSSSSSCSSNSVSQPQRTTANNLNKATSPSSESLRSNLVETEVSHKDKKRYHDEGHRERYNSGNYDRGSERKYSRDSDREYEYDGSNHKSDYKNDYDVRRKSYDGRNTSEKLEKDKRGNDYECKRPAEIIDTGSSRYEAYRQEDDHSIRRASHEEPQLFVRSPRQSEGDSYERDTRKYSDEGKKPLTQLNEREHKDITKKDVNRRNVDGKRSSTDLIDVGDNSKEHVSNRTGDRRSPNFDDRYVRNESQRFHNASKESLRDETYTIKEEKSEMQCYNWGDDRGYRGKRENYRDEQSSRNNRGTRLPPGPVTREKFEAKELESGSKRNLTPLSRSNKKPEIKKLEDDTRYPKDKLNETPKQNLRLDNISANQKKCESKSQSNSAWNKDNDSLNEKIESLIPTDSDKEKKEQANALEADRFTDVQPRDDNMSPTEVPKSTERAPDRRKGDRGGYHGHSMYKLGGSGRGGMGGSDRGSRKPPGARKGPRNPYSDEDRTDDETLFLVENRYRDRITHRGPKVGGPPSSRRYDDNRSDQRDDVRRDENRREQRDENRRDQRDENRRDHWDRNRRSQRDDIRRDDRRDHRDDTRRDENRQRLDDRDYRSSGSYYHGSGGVKNQSQRRDRGGSYRGRNGPVQKRDRYSRPLYNTVPSSVDDKSLSSQMKTTDGSKFHDGEHNTVDKSLPVAVIDLTNNSTAKPPNDGSWGKESQPSEGVRRTTAGATSPTDVNDVFATASEGEDGDDKEKMKRPLRPRGSQSFRTRKFDSNRKNSSYLKKENPASYQSKPMNGPMKSSTASTEGNKENEKSVPNVNLQNNIAKSSAPSSEANKGTENRTSSVDVPSKRNDKNLKPVNSNRKNQRNGPIGVNSGSGGTVSTVGNKSKVDLPPNRTTNKTRKSYEMKSSSRITTPIFPLFKEVGPPTPAPPPKKNAWDKPITSLKAPSVPVHQPPPQTIVPVSNSVAATTGPTPVPSVSVVTGGTVQEKRETKEVKKEASVESSAQAIKSATSLTSTTNVTPQVLENLDGSSAPVQTIIFENTNFKTGSTSDLSSSKYASAPKPQRKEKEKSDDSNNSNSVSNIVEYVPETITSEVTKKCESRPVSMSYKNDDTSDVKLNFSFEMPADKTVSPIEITHSMMVQTSSDNDLNYKIASVKKVWDGSLIEFDETKFESGSSNGTVNTPAPYSPSYGTNVDAAGACYGSSSHMETSASIDDETTHVHNDVVYSPVTQIQTVSSTYGTSNNHTVIIKDSTPSSGNVCKVKPLPQGCGTVNMTAQSSIITSSLNAQPPSIPSPSYSFSSSTPQPNLSNNVVTAAINFQAAAQHTNMTPVPSPPAVMFNTKQGAAPATPGIIPGFQLDNSQVAAARSPFGQFQFGAMGQNAATLNPQSFLVQAGLPELYSSQLTQYIQQQQTLANGSQITSPPNTVLISSSSNSLMSSTIKSTNQPIIGSKGGFSPQQPPAVFVPYELQVLGQNYVTPNPPLYATRPAGNVAGPSLQGASSFFPPGTGTGQTSFYQTGANSLPPQTGGPFGLNTYGAQSAPSSLVPPPFQNFNSQFRLPQPYLKAGVNVGNSTPDLTNNKQIPLPSQQDVLSNIMFSAGPPPINKPHMNSAGKGPPMGSFGQQCGPPPYYPHRNSMPRGPPNNVKNGPYVPMPIQRPLAGGRGLSGRMPPPPPPPGRSNQQMPPANMQQPPYCNQGYNSNMNNVVKNTGPAPPPKADTNSNPAPDSAPSKPTDLKEKPASPKKTADDKTAISG